MKLHIIFGQRKCSYEGEHAPEALDIADEYTMAENPEWLEKRLESHLNDGSFQAVKIVIVKVPDSSIDEALHPAVPAVDGTICSNEFKPEA